MHVLTVSTTRVEATTGATIIVGISADGDEIRDVHGVLVGGGLTK